MVKRTKGLVWSPEELAKLTELAASGATVLRAAAALGRSTQSVQIRARQMGMPLVGVKESRSKARAVSNMTEY